MLFYILSLAVQAGLIVHVIKTGRNSLWIWAIALIPLAGPLAYIVVELVPALFAGSAARKARAGMQRVIDPDADLRAANAQVQLSGDVDSRRRLGEKYFEREEFEQAESAYRSGLAGLFEHDPTLLLGVARAQFELRKFTDARATLDRLIEKNPDFKSPEGHLLYARALEEEGDLERAAREYEVLDGSFPGAEARLRHGLLLKRLGKMDEAKTILRELVEGAKIAPRHYRKAQAKWLDMAAREQ